MGAEDVAIEGGEARVNFVVSIVDHAGRVVGHEHINSRECSERALNVCLIEQIIALRFVFPSAAESSKGDATNCVAAKMEINNGSRETRTAIVIAFDGEYMSAAAALGGVNDGLIR